MLKECHLAKVLEFSSQYFLRLGMFQNRPFSGYFVKTAAYKNKASFYREFVLICSMHINTVLMEKHVRNLVCPLCYLPDIESENIEFDFYFSMIEREVSENPSISRWYLT